MLAGIGTPGNALASFLSQRAARLSRAQSLLRCLVAVGYSIILFYHLELAWVGDILMEFYRNFLKIP